MSQAFDWTPGDTGAFSYPDCPTVVFPCQTLARRGVKVAKIIRHGCSLRTDYVERVLDQTEARLLMVASVDFATGAACGALARRPGT
ncbi:hypothetical protein DQK91_23055 [Oceanidesulfovibrio marinus]|uniref:Uncharacterized protein n=1 Tax=Oceanidesulfovibrio marinus TaxID=370038 RepID=A0A6P1Z8T8_9BACT|nr:hypothetical protein DQK91_23055 [Oceanidesulfovibrio marinus]